MCFAVQVWFEILSLRFLYLFYIEINRFCYMLRLSELFYLSSNKHSLAFRYYSLVKKTPNMCQQMPSDTQNQSRIEV